MAMNPSFTKRQKELSRQAHNAEKAKKREQRKEEKKRKVRDGEGEDPDIAGIVPGPQPQADDEASPPS
ncbi:MAG: hypothetical protein HY791_31005 [Deltaproteobacteria bacterium]|nr:hypothetical protein [Deltaproteobacteria bacterium]